MFKVTLLLLMCLYDSTYISNSGFGMCKSLGTMLCLNETNLEDKKKKIAFVCCVLESFLYHNIVKQHNMTANPILFTKMDILGL